MQETAPSESQSQHQSFSQSEDLPPSSTTKKSGAIIEGAFVDPAYTWPPEEGVGKHAFEVVSKGTGSTEEDLAYPEVPKIKARRRVITETEVVTTGRCGGLFKCCTSEEAVVNTHTETIPENEEEREKLKKDYLQKRDQVKQKRRERKAQKEAEANAASSKYANVPEGVLIYRLDTTNKSITLISAPNSNTDMKNLMTEMTVVDALPSRSSSRRGILLTGSNGETYEIVACEQRTATSWMETINMMLGKDRHGMKKVSYDNGDD